VLMIDIDHFKRVNDTFGHETGDAVLREVATVLRQCTRSQDLVARYGGEEFVVALPIASLGLATERAERIRRGLSARRILAQGAPLRITASIGVAFTPAGRPLPVEALIASADQSLYRAKDGGRDRVVSGRGSTMNPPEPDTREEEDEPVATSESRQFVMGGGE
jgi:two-component system cell cycle response regulator